MVAFKNNVARHVRDVCGGGVGRDNYKRSSCIEECETLWLWNVIVVAFKNNVARHARDVCGGGVGWGGKL